MDSQHIRQHYRQLRRELSSDQQAQHAFVLAENIRLFLRFKHDLKIGCYLSTQGEISLSAWMNSHSPHQIYLPVLYEPIDANIRFAPFNEKTQWHHNRFNIVEPKVHWGQTVHARQLDLIFMPLVAFDSQGYRLGMGGGYYDRSLAFRRFRKVSKKPALVGVAHSLQQHPELPHQQWDVPLDAVITESRIIYFRNN